jgi:hypothetical protein
MPLSQQDTVIGEERERFVNARQKWQFPGTILGFGSFEAFCLDTVIRSRTN